MKEQSLAVLFALGAIAFWSTVATAFKISLRFVSPLQLLALSSFVSFLVLFGTLVARGRAGLLFKASPRDMVRSAVLGLFNPFLYYMVLFAAYSRLLGQEALVLNYVWPIVLVLLSALLLKQALKAKVLIALVLSFSGVICIATRGDLSTLEFSDPVGIILALGSSLFWALYWIFNMKDGRDEAAKLCANFLFGFIYSLLALLILEPPVFPPFNGWLGALYVGLFEMGFTFLLWMKALKHSRTTAVISNLVFLSPFISLVFLHLVVGERIYPSTFFGLVLIVAGILIQRYRRGTRKKGYPQRSL
jgi:drug/metabolite transporter (DMT)-like permease